MVITNLMWRRMNQKVECDLCGMVLPDEEIRIIRHTEFHTKAWIQHRNTTQGIPKWKIVK